MNSPQSRLKECLLATLLAFLLASNAALATQAKAAKDSAETDLTNAVRVETIQETTAALSADDMEGRGTAQAGGDRAAQYIADRFAKIGLKPLGAKDSYLQRIKFRETEVLPESALKIGDETLKLGPDFVVTPPISGERRASGRLVFIAYGIVSSALNRNDLGAGNLNGSVVVMIQGPPKNVDRASWKKAHAQSAILGSLVRQGVSGFIFVNNGTEQHPYSETSDYLTRRQVELANEEEVPETVPPFLMVSNGTAEKLFAGSGVSFSEALALAERERFSPISLKRSASITVRLKKGKGAGSNVVGFLEGSDPVLKAEAVVYTAHYDAWGMTNGNRVFHGAADNGLGVGQLMAVAEAFASSHVRPRRSIIFLAVTGEEHGLYGSQYWVDNPTWKLKKVAADLNFDGMGTEVYGPVGTLVGYGAEHSSLGELLGSVASTAGLKIIPDPMPDEKTFYRSDHYSFAKKGVPSLMLLGAPAGAPSVWIERMKVWEKTDYHQATDTIRPDWNWDGPKAVAAIGAVIGFRVANSDQLPSWLPSSPFNRERGTNAEPPPEP
jgi:Peptidase family M28